jgi:hypothetical protein
VVQKFVQCIPNSILQSRELKSLRTQQALYLFFRITFLISLTHNPSSGKRYIGRTFPISQMFLNVQQRSVIRYDCLREYNNQSIHTEFCCVYHEAAFYPQAVEKWAVRFRWGQETVEDDSRPGRPPKGDLGDAVLPYLDKQPHSSLGEINKVLCSPKTTILQILHDLGL